MTVFANKVKAGVQADLDKIYLRHLRVISFIYTCYYAFISITHFLFLDKTILVPVVTTSLLAFLGGLVIYLLIRLGKVAPHQSHVAFLPIGLLALLTIYTHIFLSGEELQLTNAILAIYVFGFLTLSPAIFTGLMVLTGVVYLLAVNIIPVTNEAHFCFMLAAAILLSVMGFMLRYKSLLSSVRMTDNSRRKTQRLVAISSEVKTRIAEVEKANAAKDQFLANMTHELRTPLTGTMGMLELLQDTKLTEEQNFMINTAQKSSRYLLNIVNDLLDLSMLDAGQLLLSEKPVDLVRVTQLAVEEFREDAAAKDISLSIGKLPEKAIKVVSDEARLIKILRKLVSNAVKFTEEGGVIVSLNWTPPTPEKPDFGTVTWRVADTGPGIPVDKIDTMFNRFEQLNAQITRTSSGTGLGLSIARELVDMMGGSIEVKSDVDKGTIFTLTLELPVESAKSKLETAILSGDEAGKPTDMGLNVLVAEDNHINQLVIRSMLQKLGMDVTIVSNGQLAVEACVEADPAFDIVFMDIQMPIMDGMSASRIIKIRSASAPPIIAVTANTSDQDVLSYKEAGIDAVIGKPIDYNHFRAVILSVLNARKKKNFKG